MPDIDGLLQAIDYAESTSIGHENDSTLSNERALSIDAYLGKNIEPDPEGMSQVVDRSVFETVEWMLPSFCRIFAGGDNVVEFVPMDEDDEEAARQESDYLNYIVTQKNNWFEIVMTFCKDALLTKNAYALVEMEEKTQVESETYRGQTREGLAMLLDQDGVQPVAMNEYPDPAGSMEPLIDEATGQPQIDEASVQFDPETGEPIPETVQPVMVPRTLYDVTIKRTKPQRNLRIRVLPPERCKIDSNCRSYRLDDADYFEYYEEVTISSLRQQGYEIPDDIGSDEDDFDSLEEEAREQYADMIDRNDDMSPVDPSMRKVRCRKIWIRYDYDGDGVGEMQEVMRVGNEIFFRQETTRIPVACIVPAIMTHTHVGLSITDMVFDIQRIRTAVLRQGLNNLYLSNNSRHIVSDKVDLDALLTSAPGGIIELDPGAMPSEGHVMALETPFVFPQAMQALDQLDQIRESRTGMNRLFQGVDENVMSETASGVAQLSSMAAQRIEQIARIFAGGIEYLFSVAHELILRHGMQAEKVKLRNEWVEVDPATWKHGRDLRIVAPVGAGNKDAQVARMLQILRVQGEAAAAGSRTIQENNVYEAQIELAKTMDFISPDKFFTDPATLPPPEEKPTDVEIAAETERMKIESDERTKSAQMSSDYEQFIMDKQVAVYRANLEAEVRLLIEDAKRTGTMDVERLRNVVKMAPIPVGEDNISAARAFTTVQDQVVELGEVLGDAMSQFAQAIDALREAQTAPKELVRDQSGKPVGVRTVQ